MNTAEPNQPIEDYARSLVASGEFVRLGPDGYEAYRKIAARACWALRQWYQGEDSAARQDEVQATAPLVERFVRTVELLLFRHRFSPAHDLALDFVDGGFPHLFSVRELAGDHSVAPENVAKGETRERLREQILHEIFDKARDPVELVWAIAERTYMKRLCDRESPEPFLPFTMGELVRGDTLPNGRISYHVTWGCYDSVTNLPHVHRMSFEWSGDRPLEDDRTLRTLFHTVISAEGGRVPPIGLLANMIDRDLPQVHPKRLVRTRIGPLRTARFSREKSPVVEALRRFGGEEDFALEVLVEGVESMGEFSDKPKNLLEKIVGGQVLQHLFVRQDDPECERSLASYVFRRLLLPHAVRQGLTAEGVALAEFRGGQILTYTADRVNVA